MTPTTPARTSALRRWVTRETTGGALLIGAALVALVWANSPWREAYETISTTRLGPAAWHLDLDLAHWAADGLLAIFFFTVGLELKREIVVGSLRDPRRAAVPVLAAVGGMAVPAIIYASVVHVAGDTDAYHGWAIPTATDIAFALAVLAIFGRGLPVAIRTFLLTLAVVDDLLAIVVIAVFYTDTVSLVFLALSLVAVALFALLARSSHVHPWLLIPLAVVAWGLMHSSGVHATIAGVLLGMVVPARPVHGEAHDRAHRYDEAVRPWSAGIALPVFAFFSAGVTVVGGGGQDLLTHAVLPAVAGGLVVGKVVGVLGTTALVTRLTPLRLPDAVGLRDLLPVGLLAGIGFTVSLLIAELSFADEVLADTAKFAVLAGTAVSAVAAALVLHRDAKRARGDDMNDDGVPDGPQEVIGADRDR
ncbi:Na+/H+ antiporter NhaA [Cellulomonas triticagri]|uniref:Na(+)/H(+) antiporter NhaA n=1 Tax=Cellulomonas triticagri TaxID=2483352 RepID=A0A3M2JAN0_9CELL|nr:Na+/H+ antiporter NhaA [Cellulomonas triticagri]RMI09191.1 Na+/H+ antiporter NhaA [Cellulomonas triticagri]